MIINVSWRKAVLVAHITTSVGWLGAVAAYVALDVAAITTPRADTVRAAWLARDLIVSDVIVPLALASVVIGVVNALATHWGLFRHYWVVMELLLTLVATSILLQEAQSVGYMAMASVSSADPRPGSLMHSVGGLVVLIIVTILSVFKPRGVTRYGWRKQQQQRDSRRAQRAAT